MELLVWLVTLCTLAATMKFALVGWVKFPENPILQIVSNENWLFSLFLFVPWLVGNFSRGETSPLPWVAFLNEYSRHGASSAVLTAMMVVIVNIWLFWAPAQIYNDKHFEKPLKQRWLVRAINLLVGLLLVTAGNPVYRFLERLH